MTRGSGEDFASVFERHFEGVYGYVAFRLAPNLDAAQDVTQEVFASALKGWAAYRRQATPLTWLRAIARRKVADYYRSARPTVALDTNLLVEVTGEKPAARQRAEILSAALGSLPAGFAELLEEKYVEGLSVRKMAKQRKKTIKAVGSALSRARAMLREKYLKLQAEQETCHELL